MGAKGRVRAWLRPVKRAVMRPGVARALRSRDWERKWRHEEGLDWQPGDVAPEVAAAFDSGWLGQGGTVLDLGCGSGGNTAWLADRGFAVLGVDVSPTAIDRARVEHPENENLVFDVVDVSAPDPLKGRSFEIVIDRGCLHGLPDGLQQVYAENVTGWVSHGGPFLLIMHAQSSQKVEERLSLVSSLFGDAFTIEGHETVEALAYRHGNVLGGVAIRLRRS